MDTRENISRHTQGLPNDNITPGIPNDNITPEVGVLVKQQRSDSLTKHIEPHTETMGASLNSINESTRPRLPASPRAEAATTPKRKLSPIESTPTGRQRKLSTTAYNSPKLRGAIETAGGNLIHLEQVRAPDLITGIAAILGTTTLWPCFWSSLDDVDIVYAYVSCEDCVSGGLKPVVMMYPSRNQL